MKSKEIYQLKLHETLDIDDFVWCRRVAGGWIYYSVVSGSSTVTSVFVPFDNEFMGKN